MHNSLIDLYGAFQSYHRHSRNRIKMKALRARPEPSHAELRDRCDVANVIELMNTCD